jgi:hypothetical protein
MPVRLVNCAFMLQCFVLRLRGGLQIERTNQPRRESMLPRTAPASDAVREFWQNIQNAAGVTTINLIVFFSPILELLI